jgi:hypothetical protein
METLHTKIDHQRRAELHAHAAELIAINNIFVDPSWGRSLIEFAEKRELLVLDPTDRQSIGLPPKAQD